MKITNWSSIKKKNLFGEIRWYLDEFVSRRDLTIDWDEVNEILEIQIFVTNDFIFSHCFYKPYFKDDEINMEKLINDIKIWYIKQMRNHIMIGNNK